MEPSELPTEGNVSPGGAANGKVVLLRLRPDGQTVVEEALSPPAT